MAGRPRFERTTPIGKVCAKCGFAWLADQFWPCAKAHDGLQTWCKSCQRTYNAALMAKRRQKVA